MLSSEPAAPCSNAQDQSVICASNWIGAASAWGIQAHNASSKSCSGIPQDMAPALPDKRSRLHATMRTRCPTNLVLQPRPSMVLEEQGQIWLFHTKEGVVGEDNQTYQREPGNGQSHIATGSLSMGVGHVPWTSNRLAILLPSSTNW